MQFTKIFLIVKARMYVLKHILDYIIHNIFPNCMILNIFSFEKCILKCTIQNICEYIFKFCYLKYIFEFRIE